jgi:glycosyltransferase involved in cell wall biosynthesis
MVNNMQTTVLFITHYSGMYGANQSMCRLIVELRQDYGINPVVLIPSSGEICDFLNENGIKYYVSHYYWWVNAEKGVFQYLLNWRKQFINFSRVKRLTALVKPEQIDLVYSNSITINIGTFISRKLSCPHIWHLRESLESYKFKFSLGKVLSRLFLKEAADKYIVISDYLRRCYAGLLPTKKIQLIYNGIDFSRVKGVETKPADGIHLCMMGIVCEQKNNLDALKALNIVVNSYHFTHIRLHLIGGSKSDYLKTLTDFMDATNLRDYVVFHGHTKNIDAILTNMHIGLMCSRGEAFGRVTVEYMMHSMPVIASNSGANTEIVKENVNGTIYTIYDASELADKISRFVTQPELLKRMAKSAYDYGKENFSSERNTALIYEVIQEVVVSSR